MNESNTAPDEEWIKQMADLDDGCDVGVGMAAYGPVEALADEKVVREAIRLLASKYEDAAVQAKTAFDRIMGFYHD